VPTRIAFQVSAKVDSRTILDQMGAENLLGHGDMLYLPPGTSLPVRVHGAFVDDNEVHAVVRHLKKSGAPRYMDEILDGPSGPTPGLAGIDKPGDFDDAEQDALYDQAVQVVMDTRKASISGVQRRLKIGYNRAARMVEAMETAGLVGPLQSNGSREILVPTPAKED
jgi:S-DNA-T family DNA segregation ATPase FtsK/SpoIIIE